jgi:hypothetical protein
MSDLQLGLLLAAGGVVGLVVLFNWAQEWRYRRQAKAAFAQQHSDVLLNTPKNNVRDAKAGARLEPVLLDDENMPDAPEPEPVAASQRAAVAAAAPVAALATAGGDDEDDGPPVILRSQRATASDEADKSAIALAMLDPHVDYIAELHVSTPVSSECLARPPVDKRVQWIGRNERGCWEAIGREQLGRKHPVRYTELRIGLQLADRQGPVNPVQLDTFGSHLKKLAQELSARLVLPARDDALQRAQTLDAFCAEVDVLIGLNLVSRGAAINGSKIRGLAEASGMVLEADGAFHYTNDSGNTLYSLVSMDQTPFHLQTLRTQQLHGVTLLFDVPRVAGGLTVFDHLVDVARQMAEALDVDLVDDQRRPLTDHAIGRIRKQLDLIFNHMDDRGIAPGSMVALRLFA